MGGDWGFHLAAAVAQRCKDDNRLYFLVENISGKVKIFNCLDRLSHIQMQHSAPTEVTACSLTLVRMALLAP
jgi:hypothetical protein